MSEHIDRLVLCTALLPMAAIGGAIYMILGCL
jgi:hypothetical protein